jgi:hypothetical protein
VSVCCSGLCTDRVDRFVLGTVALRATSFCVCFCVGDGKLCVPSGRKAFRLERVFYRGLFDTQGVSLGSSSSRCCVCVIPC